MAKKHSRKQRLGTEENARAYTQARKEINKARAAKKIQRNSRKREIIGDQPHKPIFGMPPMHRVHIPKRSERCRTFEDEYRMFRKTRGKKGWSANPDARKDENIWQTERNSIFNCGKFHLTDLISKPITLFNFNNSDS